VNEPKRSKSKELVLRANLILGFLLPEFGRKTE
jgi:hypothetical protein